MYSYLETINPKGSLNSKEFFQAVLCVIIMFVSTTLWHKRRKLSKKQRLVEIFPGAKKYGFLGSIPELYFIAFDPPRILLDWISKMSKKHDPSGVFKYWMLNDPKIIVTDPDIAIKLYNQDCLMGKSAEVTKQAPVIGGSGLLALPADIHPLRRKQWMPSFTRKQVENSIKFFREQSIKLCDKLEVFEKNGQVFDLMDMSVMCTFNAICYSAFGEDYMAKLPESVGINHMNDLHSLSLKLTARIFKPWPWDWIDCIYFNLSRDGREVMRNVKRANLLTKQAVHERQKYLKSLNMKMDEGATSSKRSSEDFECFLDHMLLLMTKGELTENEVIQELNVFIAAGYDTSGITICYALYLLSLHPEHQEKIVEELCQVIPPEYWEFIKDYEISALDTKQMKYMELCVKETLRLYPILPLSPRRTTHDVELPDGRILPGEVDVFVMINMIHRHPKYFPEPDKFIPERHLKPIPALMPFTLGSRNCIGQVYAMFEMKVVLAYLLMSYKWETTETANLKTIFQTLLVPENGLHFKITKRTF